jgi:hypothetical protein
MGQKLRASGARRWKGAAINDGALAVSALVEIQNCGFTEQRQVMSKLVEIFTAQDVLLSPMFRPPRHGKPFYDLRFIFAIKISAGRRSLI